MRRQREAGVGTLLVYGLPVVALSAPFFLLQFFGLAFGTEVLGLAPGRMGAILAAGRIWDALTDPLVGAWSDRTRSRWGRRAPWMLAAVPVVAASIVLLWRPPQAPASAVPWLVFFLLVFTTAFTAWVVPHQALGAELSTDPHLRTRLFGVRQASLMSGLFVAFACMQTILGADSPRATAARTGVVLGVFAMVVLPIPALTLREAAAPVRPKSSLRAYRDVLGNRLARRLLAVWGIDQLGLAVGGVLGPYAAIYLLERPDLVGAVPAMFVVPSIFSVPLWVYVARSVGRTRAWQLSLALAAGAFLPLALGPLHSLPLLASCLIAAGFASGCAGAVGPALLAGVIDEDAEATGERKEGAYTAAWLLVLKVAGAAVAFGAGTALSLSGFVPNQAQAPATLLTMRILFGALPALASAIGAWLLGRWLGLFEREATAPLLVAP
jgi:Na+/melibiose symporter-like transporter